MFFAKILLIHIFTISASLKVCGSCSDVGSGNGKQNIPRPHIILVASQLFDLARHVHPTEWK
uniref:Secreted protein n=1 Tax=Arundo donax TaxID=35708 RepID=A0A0A9HS02_ARUDO